jgi:hypothetical protein
MRSEVILIKNASLIALTLVLFSLFAVTSQSITSRVYQAGIEAVEEHIYGNNTIILVYPNPKVYFSYRNVHVVPRPPSQLDELIELYDKAHRVITAGVLPRHVFEEKLELLRQSLNDENIAPGDILLTRSSRTEETTNVGSVNVSDLAPPFYIVDLTNKSTSQVARIVGEVFSDMSNLTIIIYDARLKELQDLYNETCVRDYLYNVDSQLIEELTPVMNKTANALRARNCFAHMVIGGFTIGAVFPWTKLAVIGITREYRDCADIIEPYVREMADIARKYIPDEIPLYVIVEENMGPIVLAPPEPGLNIKNVALAVGIIAVATTILVVVWSIVKKPKP